MTYHFSSHFLVMLKPMEPYTDGNIKRVSVKPGILEDPVGSEFDIVYLISAYWQVLYEAACSFLAAQPRNNHTETVLIKSLLGLLALVSYWQAITS